MSAVPLYLHNPKPGILGADRGVDASSSVVSALLLSSLALSDTHAYDP